MIKKTLYFGNPAYLYIKEAQLCVDYPDKTLQTRSIPVEDVGIVIIDHQQISLTHFLINSLIDNNAAVLFCNQKHLPNGLILPMAVNSLYTKKLQCQIETTEPLKKQLWRQTIKAKIYNQAEVLKWAGADDGKLRTIHSKVTSGDPENMEGVAAGIYWQHLFQEDQIFKRHRFGPPPNQLFNYGYAILRAIAARSLVASGCLPAIGIHHHNQYNAFCLADDIMEPYRPYVDRLILEFIKTNGTIETEEIEKEHKIALLQVPVIDVFMGSETSPLMVAMQRTTSSLMKCFEGEARKIVYPVML